VEAIRMSNHKEGGRDSGRGPRALGEVLGELFVARGLGQLRSATELEQAWAQVTTETEARQTRVAGLRHGILTVTVTHPALLEELAAFRKPELLEAIRKSLPGIRLHDLRFRIGTVSQDE
jgi:predicted nucleic acid-binding Zn ribbon protein